MPASPHERYVFKPFFGSSHWWALRKCAKLPASTRLLDFGCGSGAIGQELKARGWDQLFAVEIDPRSRQAAASWYTQVVSDVSFFKQQSFDVILLLDVLEHLADPAALLHELTKQISPGGSLLISVPNVGHWSVRIPLLFGFFEYSDRGILDRTHLQFFVRQRLVRMLKEFSCLELADLSASVSPAELVLPPAIWDNAAFRSLSKLRLSCANFLPGLFAYQHLAELKKVTNGERSSSCR